MFSAVSFDPLQFYLDIERARFVVALFILLNDLTHLLNDLISR
jgi:hypothetical protein